VADTVIEAAHAIGISNMEPWPVYDVCDAVPHYHRTLIL